MKKYAVQYAYTTWVDTKIVTDTNPITYEEALAIFKGHLDDFKYRLKEEQHPQLVIWEDVGDGEFPIYGTELIDLDYRDELEIQGEKIYKVVTNKEEIIIPE